MINTSAWYQDLCHQNAQPACLPMVTVEGVDAGGNNIRLRWTDKEIVDLKYKRTIDPAGRELPSMSLEWTEFYMGRLDQDNYVEKYKGILPLMKVTVTFTQCKNFNYNYGDYLNYVALKDAGDLDPEETYDFEAVDMPALFLIGRPEVNDNTIKWTAKDFIFFLTEPICYYFANKFSYNTPVSQRGLAPGVAALNAIKFLLMRERRNFNDVALAYLNTVISLFSWPPSGHETELIKDYLAEYRSAFFLSDTKNALLNFLTVFNCFTDYHDEYDELLDVTYLLKVRKLNEYDLPVFFYDMRIMKAYPKITVGKDISAYNYKSNDLVVDLSSAKTAKDYGCSRVFLMSASGISFYATRVDFRNYGLTEAKLKEFYQDVGASAPSPKEAYTVGFDPSYAVIYKTAGEAAAAGYSGRQDLAEENEIVYGMGFASTDRTINISQNGEVYDEQNPMIDVSDALINDRVERLTDYFNSSKKTIEFEALPNLAVETSDVITVESNLYRGDDQINYNAVVVQMELTYSGALWQKITCHSISEQEE